MEHLVTEADDGRTLAARTGDTLVIRLSETASAGYRWVIAGVDRTLIAIDDPESDHDAQATGTAGTAIFHARVLAPGTSSIRLDYRRPWESAAIARHFHCTIAASG